MKQGESQAVTEAACFSDEIKTRSGGSDGKVDTEEGKAGQHAQLQDGVTHLTAMKLPDADAEARFQELLRAKLREVATDYDLDEEVVLRKYS